MKTLADRLNYLQLSVGADKLYVVQNLEAITVQAIWLFGNRYLTFERSYKLAEIVESSVDYEETFIAQAIEYYNNVKPLKDVKVN